MVKSQNKLNRLTTTKVLCAMILLSYMPILSGCKMFSGSRPENTIDSIVSLNATSDTVIITQADDISSTYNSSYQYSVIIKEEGSYLCDSSGKQIAGPYAYIEDELHFSWDDACRYKNDEGLIGYLGRDGKPITEPKFIYASEMTDGRALVSEKDGAVYYLDKSGFRFTRDYLPGSYPFEHQGFYARVKTIDGWAIINRDDELLLEGAKKINELPCIDIIGTAIMSDDSIVLFSFYGVDDEFTVYRKLNRGRFVDVSEMYYASFALVKNASNLYGVIDYNGDLVITDIYKSIAYKVVNDGPGSWLGDHVIFTLENLDGSKQEKEVFIGEGVYVGNL